MSDALASLKDLVTALREAGVSHYDGWVPGWPEGTTTKLVVGAAPVPASLVPTEPKQRRAPTPEEREAALDAAVLGHVRIHGGPDAATGKA